MTEKEIIQGLNCCSQFLCTECPYQKYEHKEYTLKCMHLMIVDVAKIMSEYRKDK